MLMLTRILMKNATLRVAFFSLLVRLSTSLIQLWCRRSP